MATTTSQASQYPYHAVKPHRLVPVLYGEMQFAISCELMKTMPPDAPLDWRRSVHSIPICHASPKMFSRSSFCLFPL
jgi:hypothetical protein